MNRLNAARALAVLTPTFNDTENGFLTNPTSALDLLVAFVFVHVLGEATDECLVRLYLTAHFQKRSGLHSKANPVIHEPCRLLRHTERAVHFVATDPVLAVSNHPNRSKPLPKVK